MSSERAIVRSILAYLNNLPCCLARKRWGAGMGIAGDPDIDACIRGRSLQLEVKRPGEEPTVLQAKRLAEWRKAGAAVGAVHSLNETRDFLIRNSLLEWTDSPDSPSSANETERTEADAQDPT
jgi:hypothetical protein